MLAADYPQLVEGLILYSPNIKIKNPLAPLLSGPWDYRLPVLSMVESMLFLMIRPIVRFASIGIAVTG